MVTAPTTPEFSRTVPLSEIGTASKSRHLTASEAERKALALEPFPRSPNADAALKAAGVKAEGEVGPFSALAALKEKLEKK